VTTDDPDDVRTPDRAISHVSSSVRHVTTIFSGESRPTGTKVRPRVKTLRVDRRDEGFTLVELLVTMIIAGVLTAIGMFTFANYLKVSQQRGSAREVVSLFRTASERAISEGRTYCVDIAADGRSTTMYRYACDGAATSVASGRTKTQSPKVTLSATVSYPAPTPACPSGDKCVYFYPRGTATPTTVTVLSSVRSRVYTVTVEGLTARVYSPQL
jgi:prepilin-type N-terminal cleavage/methylation domain-containing protein